MKKLFLGVLAIAGLVACVQEDVVNTPNLQEEIGFGGYVNGAVRSADPSTTTGSINHFTVWAYADNSQGLVLEDELVSKSGDVWTYSNVQYWLKKHNYRFFALTPYVANQTNNAVLAGLNDPYENYLGGLRFTNVDGTEDLLYATAEVSTQTSIPESVQFAFDHLLSKIKFTFVNGFTTDNIDLAVTNIKMVVPATASTTLGAQVHNGYVWTGHADELTLDFGNAGNGERIDATKNAKSDNERLTFPAQVDANLTYKVTFTVDQYIGTQTTSAATYNLETTITGVELVAGKAYNFVAAITHETLDLEAIEFEVTVDEWDSEDFDLGVVGNTEVKVVYTFDELQAVLNDAAARGVSVNAILGADIAGQVKVQEIPGVVTTIDGHNHTLTGAILVDGKSGYKGATTVVKNVNFVADAATLVNGDSFIWCGEALGTNLRYPDNITVENCTFTATGVTAVAVKVWSLGNADHKLNTLTIKDVTATGLHSLAQLTSSHGKVVVDNVTVNAKNGISLGIIGSADIKNSTINAEGYGVRANGCVATTNIENTTINANQPVVVRNVTVAGYVLNVDEKSTLTTTEPYDVVFTAGDDDLSKGPYVAPSVEFTYNVPASCVVFPAVADATVVTTVDEFKAALASEDTIVISGAIELSEIIYINKAVTLLGKGTDASLAGKFVANADVEFQNIKFVANTATDLTLVTNTYGSKVNGIYSAIVTVNRAAAKFEGCEFSGKLGINYFLESVGKVLTVNNCKFSGATTGIYSKILCKVTNSTFDLTGTSSVPLYVWPRQAGTTNSVCHFVDNTVVAPALAYIGMLTQSGNYANVEFNLQGIDGTSTYSFAWSNSARCATDGSVTFAEGSKTFTINADGTMK